VTCILLSTSVGYETEYETMEYQFLFASFQKSLQYSSVTKLMSQNQECHFFLIIIPIKHVMVDKSVGTPANVFRGPVLRSAMFVYVRDTSSKLLDSQVCGSMGVS